MAGFVLVVLLLSMAGRSSATWCICREGTNESALQKTLDYACGAGADCTPIHSNGPCYNPNSVRAHCNYAVNSYFQKNRQAATACDFSGTAMVVNSDPSTSGCMYPASATSSTPGTTGGPTTISGTSPNRGSPLVTTPNSGILGGVNNGLGPSGMNTDMSAGAIRSPVFSSCVVLAFSALSGVLENRWYL